MDIRREKINDKIRFEIHDVKTFCLHRTSNREDYTDIQIAYEPGAYEISEDELERYIQKKVVEKELAMELIPAKILCHCLKDVVTRKPANRCAAPKEIQIMSTSKGKKKWSMTVKVGFERKIRQVQ